MCGLGGGSVWVCLCGWVGVVWCGVGTSYYELTEQNIQRLLICTHPRTHVHTLHTQAALYMILQGPFSFFVFLIGVSLKSCIYVYEQVHAMHQVTGCEPSHVLTGYTSSLPNRRLGACACMCGCVCSV